MIEEPKCNFDVEMTIDILDDTEKLTAVMLFSGDSDMCAPLERLKVKGKRIGVVGVRGMVAKELHDIKDKYIDFGKFYTGKRKYEKAKIPLVAGPRD
ncbi:MAG: NYN domain-containing protein [bacterium]